MNENLKKQLVELNANPLVRHLQKLPQEFTREDLMNYVIDNEIKRIHFRYVDLNGRLKELKLPINNKYYLERILSEGERIDGSNPYKGIISGGNSDLYIVPIYHLAFQDPFNFDALHIFCRTLGSEGKPLEMIPDNVIAKAHKRLKDKTGISMNALAELEFFLIYDPEDRFPVESQRGYHESMPFVKGSPVVDDILNIVTAMTGHVKYCHSEVGFIKTLQSEDPELDGKCLEQFELEFNPAPLEDMAAYVAMAKWAIRMIADSYGMSVTFSPKLAEGEAGSGLHIHMELMKNEKNIVLDDAGELTKESLAVIGGLMKMSKSLTAFGNTVAASYLRLTPHQEAPTKICWGKSNRSSLVRIPLGWGTLKHLAGQFNPQQNVDFNDVMGRATFEFRVPDGSANMYLLLSGLAVAAYHGLTKPEVAKLADELMVTGDIFAPENAETLAKLEDLPFNCYESAQALKTERDLYQENNIFPQILIDRMIEMLEAQNDKDLNEKLQNMDSQERLQLGRKIMHKFIHIQ